MEGVGKSRFMLTMTTEHFIFLKMDIEYYLVTALFAVFP